MPALITGPGFVQHALLLSLGLFAVGLLGVFLRRNIITVLMCVELMLNGVNLAFVAFSRARGTLPRFRYDQVMHFGWKVLIPLAILNILATAGFVVYFTP